MHNTINRARLAGIVFLAVLAGAAWLKTRPASLRLDSAKHSPAEGDTASAAAPRGEGPSGGAAITGPQPGRQAWDALRERGGDDPRALLASARALAESPLREKAIEHAGHLLAESDGPAATSLAGEFADPARRADYLRRVVYRWSAHDLPAAVAWLAGMEPGPERETAAFSIMLGWGEQDAPGAAAFVAREFPPGEIQASAALHVALRWSRLQPTAALAWVAEFPDAALRQQISQTVFEQWLYRDADAARSWQAEDRLF